MKGLVTILISFCTAGSTASACAERSRPRLRLPVKRQACTGMRQPVHDGKISLPSCVTVSAVLGFSSARGRIRSGC